MAIIEVDHVTKEYRLGQLQNIKHTLQNSFAYLCGQPSVKRKLFKALDDINFQIQEGEVVGVIGTNGAGKSTLFKLLAGVSKPTRGRVKVKGLIAPLIEVGAGLHPELTGRENIFINGAILGISRKVMRQKFDDIVEFADLKEFVDTPIKRYSSGMKIRLGFSIATSLDADTLLVDEVLAVGDLAFQRKCFDRMEELIKKNGKTVLLVSHNIRQVERLCSRAILLESGKILIDGNPTRVCNIFYQRSNEKIQTEYLNQSSMGARIKSSGEVELLQIEIMDTEGNPVDTIQSGDPLCVRIRFSLQRLLKKPQLVVGTHTTDFVYLSGSSTAVYCERPDLSAGEHEIEHIILSLPLAPGVYCIRFVIYDQYQRIVFNGETLKMFTIATSNREVHEESLRTLNLPTDWIVDGKCLSKASSNKYSLQEVGKKGIAQ